jgi:hypothetical protein
MGLRLTKCCEDAEDQNHRSLTLAARNEVPRYRAATVRESVPLDHVFKGVIMGLRPTKR